MAKTKYKNVEVKIQFARNKEDFENGVFQPSNGGKFTVLKAIQLAEMSNGACLEVYSSRGLLLIQLDVSHDKSKNTEIIPLLNKKGIEVK